MEREYLGGDVLVWRDEDGNQAVDVECIGSIPNGWIALTVTTNPASAVAKAEGWGTRWLTPQEAKEVAKALNAYAEVIEKDLGYCHDPFVER